MRARFTRRAAVLSGLAAAACAPKPESLIIDPRDSVPVDDDPIREIEHRVSGRIGVTAINTANNFSLRHRGGERFAMCSTFKWVLAADILSHVQAGKLSLDAQIRYTSANLLEYAPAARANLARGWMTVEELCAAAVEQSDNTAANLLIAQIGGPPGLTAFVRAHGDSVTRFDRVEPELNIVSGNDERDTTTPDAMAATMRTLLLTDGALSVASREKLIGWLVQSQTGANRLRAGLPADWRVGDKTGTSGHGMANDDAIAWPPNRPPILIACFVDAPAVDDDARNAAHADIARLVVQTWS